MFVLFCFALGQSVQTTTDPSFRINIYPPSRDKWVSGHLAAGKVFEETKLNFVKRLLSEPPKPVKVVDVGAHIGSFSLYVAALGHQVIAVEPLPDSVDLLNESIQENRFGNLIELYQAALTDKSQVKAGSVCMRSDPTNIGHTFVAGIDLRFENQPCHSASLITLDQLVEGQTDIYLLKIDVEGFEKRVFLGGKKFFKTFVKPHNTLFYDIFLSFVWLFLLSIHTYTIRTLSLSHFSSAVVRHVLCFSNILPLL
eukprot:c8576_g1_i1.p1 GENE.c8576_g1_i1~~c8576_g1_i1.p1  ORF type:complete len:254 (+),score=56.68 c8576_g1_i1:21-782(+)